MTTGKQNFIYAYDEDEDQIIVIDAETGERVEQENSRVQLILNHLNEQEEEIKLRKFAIWCARQCNDDIKPMQKKFLELAEQAVSQKTDRGVLQELYTQSEGEAVAVDTVGLRQGSSKAPGYLATRECVNPDALAGAKNAARFHALWAKVNKEKDEEHAIGLKEVEPLTTINQPKSAEQKQIDYLLDLIGE